MIYSTLKPKLPNEREHRNYVKQFSIFRPESDAVRYYNNPALEHDDWTRFDNNGGNKNI